MIECDPDRIALYSYAHLPTLFKPQRRILEADLPRAEVKLAADRDGDRAGWTMPATSTSAWTISPSPTTSSRSRSGRDASRAISRATRRGGDCDLVGLGVSAIGTVGPTYVQNVKTLDEYYDALDHGELPVLRGVELIARRPGAPRGDPGARLPLHAVEGVDRASRISSISTGTSPPS